MNLGRKTLLILAAASSVTIVLSYIVLETTVYATFVELENKWAAKNADTVEAEIQAQLDNLTVLNTEYSRWDDTFEYLNGVQSDYVKKYLTEQTMDTLDLDAFILLNSDGKLDISFARGMNDIFDFQSNLPYLELDPIVNSFSTSNIGTNQLSGVLGTTRGPLLLVSRASMRSDNSGPPAGSVLFVRLLTKSRIEEIQNRLNIAFDAIPINSMEIPPEVQRSLTSLNAETGKLTIVADQDNLLTYRIIPDIVGRPAFVLEVETPRDISAAGKSAMSFALMFLAMTSLLYLLVSNYSLKLMIVKPISLLTRHFGRLQESRDLSERLFSTRNDELGVLTRQTNALVEQLELAQNEMTEARDTALQANNAKSAFLATMSHEIRTPINGVLGMTELLLASKGLNEKQRRYAETVRQSGNSLLHVINDILDISKIEAGKVELDIAPFNLRHSVEECLELMAASAHSKGLELISAISLDTHTYVQGDSVRLSQILTNLIGNAVKFTEHGEIIVSVTELDDHVETTGYRFEVKDTGIGINLKNKEALFEPFTQEDGSTTRRYGGTGLGLSICERLAELMGGEIGVNSVLGQGSTFWFTAHLIKDDETSQNPIPEILADKRVLIVDDNETNREILRHQLESWHMQVEEDCSGSDAFDRLIGNSGDSPIFDVVLLDMHMPEMDGLQLAQSIKKEPSFRHVPLVMLSSLSGADNDDIRGAAKLDAWLTKPVRQARLHDTLMSLLSKDTLETRGGDTEQDSEDAIHGGSEYSLRILLAEDNDVNQAVAAEMLELLGHEITVTTNGREALAAFKLQRFDIVLMDCQMPDLDGYEATQAIRRLEAERDEPRTPIIALTANALSGDREKCLACGMDDYLSKPFKLRVLAAVLERWFKSAANEPLERPNHALENILWPVDNAAELDAAALESLRSIGEARDTDLLGRVIGIYLEQTPALIARINDSLAIRDFDELFQSAHLLKSSSANVGARQLAKMCAELESAGRHRSLEDCAIGHKDLQSAYDSVKESLASISQGGVNVVDALMSDVDDERQVLIVDDDSAFRLVAAEALRGAGFVVTEAHDGIGAVLQAQQNRPDLVLMDAVMPGIDGFETCRRFQDDTKLADVPILMATGLDDPESVDRAFDSGASGFVTKPIQYKVLSHYIRFMIRASETSIELKESRRRLATAQSMARLGYWTFNSETGEFTISEELSEICGIRRDQKIESLNQFAELIDEEDRRAFHSDIKRTVEEQVAVNADYRLRSNAGKLLHVHQQLNVECSETEPSVVVATVQDVTAQRSAEKQIRELAYYDSLTGLASRSYLYERLNEMIKSARRRNKGFALFFMDLDGFKDVNDSLGHDQGDELLKIVAGRLTESLRETDFLSRLGGDEFCMLVIDEPDEMRIGQIATRCLNNVKDAVELGGRVIHPQVSIGISRFPEDGRDSHTLLRAADSAMYAAKQSGKHCFEFFDHAMTLQAGERLELAQELRSALHNKEFELYYQPQINLESGTAVSYEALVRWNHPSKGLVSPNEFIAEMEQLGLINDLGNWVMREACRQIVLWREDGMGDMQISVNIAPTHFQRPNFVSYVENVLQEFGVAPHCLVLEITETSIQHEGTLSVFKKLKERGVKIAIDDFGSGYSSLSSLQHLPIDYLKIDRVFIKDLLSNPKDAVFLGIIMSMAHALGISVVAEGVEELEQIQILRSLDCDTVQGFYFSRPVPANEISKLATRSFLPNKPAIRQLDSLEVH